MNFFLRDVWKQSKIVFAFFIVFILGTLFCTFSKIEITPFFLWAHYSDKQTPTGKFERICIKVNGEFLDLQKLSRPTREMIQLPTEYFVNQNRTGFAMNTRQIIQSKLAPILSAAQVDVMEDRLCNSHSDTVDYLKWLANYIERTYSIKVSTMEIGTCELVFNKDRSVTRQNVDFDTFFNNE
jgi:hypothetical protein